MIAIHGDVVLGDDLDDASESRQNRARIASTLVEDVNGTDNVGAPHFSPCVWQLVHVGGAFYAWRERKDLKWRY